MKHQHNHRSIRSFDDRPVEAEMVKQLLEIMNRSATSSGLQSYSVIHLTDPEKRQQLAKVCQQAYITQIPELFVFIVDNYRNYAIARAKGYEGNYHRTMDHFFRGIADAYLAAQNLMTAIESLDMGGIFLGSIINHPMDTIQILELPVLTFPVVGLGFGYPAESPNIKPRMDVSLKVGENGYPYWEDNILDAIKDYDEVMSHYYDTRDHNQRSDTFSNQIFKQALNEQADRANILEAVEKQGYLLRYD